MDSSRLMVTIPLSVYTEMIRKLSVQDILEKKDAEISELTSKMQEDIDGLKEEVNSYRNMWYTEYLKNQKLEEKNA